MKKLIISLVFFISNIILTFPDDLAFLKKNHFTIEENEIIKDLRNNMPYKLDEVNHEYLVINDFEDNIFSRSIGESKEIYYLNLGVDFFTYRFKNEIYPVSSGTVFDTSFNEELGIYIIIKHSEIIYTIYGHLDGGNPLVKKGDPVTQKTLIGYSGKSGSILVGGPRSLHYGIVINNQYINPLKILNMNVMRHIVFTKNYKPKEYTYQYEPPDIKKLQLTRDRLIYTYWGPDVEGSGLYLKFLKNFDYEISSDGGFNIRGKYEIKDNFVTLTPDKDKLNNMISYLELQMPQQFEYEYDCYALAHSIKLKSKTLKDFYDLNSKPDRSILKKIDEVDVYSTGIKKGVISREIYIRSKPSVGSDYFLTDYANFQNELSPFLPVGHMLLIYAETKEEYTVNGKTGRWYYCNLNIKTFSHITLNSDYDKKDMPITQRLGWVFSQDIDLAIE